MIRLIKINNNLKDKSLFHIKQKRFNLNKKINSKNQIKRKNLLKICILRKIKKDNPK